jgi:hypothetical protein
VTTEAAHEITIGAPSTIFEQLLDPQKMVE